MGFGSKFFGIGACLLVMGCVDVLDLQSSTRDARVDGSYKTFRENWVAGSITIVHYKIINMDGNVGVCAAYSFKARGGEATVQTQYMRSRKIRAGDEFIYSNLSFARKFEYRTPKRGIRARCRGSSTPWRRGYSNGRIIGGGAIEL